jgi:hypothetical protein
LIEDLDQAIVLQNDIVNSTTNNSPNFLNNLGGLLLGRFEITALTDDLNQAVALWEQSESLSPNKIDRDKCLGNLGSGLLHGFRQTGFVSDLDAAIQKPKWTCGKFY